ncbi:hypothetical protein [Micromonospora aurantiaca]|nr:hypothetical protein [Micromonospora aurantiaca]UFN92698.1 hypothetical protein LF814_22205 [Micromonospora aurantiaca]
MLELVAVRLEAVGPEAARFHGATLDLRAPDGSSLSAAHLVAPNGAGKTLLAQLTELVVVPDRSMHLLKTLLARPGLVPAGRVGQVVLEWYDGVHGDSLVTGAALHRGDQGTFVNHYAFYARAGADIDALAFAEFTSLHALRAAIENFADGDFSQPVIVTDDWQTWTAYLRGCGLGLASVVVIDEAHARGRHADDLLATKLIRPDDVSDDPQDIMSCLEAVERLSVVQLDPDQEPAPLVRLEFEALVGATVEQRDSPEDRPALSDALRIAWLDQDGTYRNNRKSLSGAESDFRFASAQILSALARQRRGADDAPLVVFVESGGRIGPIEQLASVCRSWRVQVVWLTADATFVLSESVGARRHIVQVSDQPNGRHSVIDGVQSLRELLSAHAQESPDPAFVALTDVFDVHPAPAAPQPGDLLIPRLRRVGAGGRAEIVDERCRSAEASTLLRPREALSPGAEVFYASYLGGDALLGHRGRPGQVIVIQPDDLRAVRVPRPDQQTLRAITDLTDAAKTFLSWQQDAHRAVDSFFRWRDLDASRAQLITAGRLTRQRRDAAHTLDEQGSRTRTTMPYPVARRWRAVEAAQADDSGYGTVLECAEATVAYCAGIGAALAVTHALPPSAVQALARKLRQGTPVTFGTWTKLLGDLRSAASSATLPADSPLQNYRAIPDTALAAVRGLQQRRNDAAHGRGPAVHEIPEFVRDARAQLEAFISAVEWLVDYPLRHVESSKWDSFTGTTTITYRELMGDHNVVAVTTEATQDHMEAGSTYLGDQFGRYSLLRPLLHTDHCPACGQFTVFLIDSWSHHDERAEFKALDHSHVCHLPAGVGLRALGFLRE